MNDKELNDLRRKVLSDPKDKDSANKLAGAIHINAIKKVMTPEEFRAANKKSEDAHVHNSKKFFDDCLANWKTRASDYIQRLSKVKVDLDRQNVLVREAKRGLEVMQTEFQRQLKQYEVHIASLQKEHAIMKETYETYNGLLTQKTAPKPKPIIIQPAPKADVKPQPLSIEKAKGKKKKTITVEVDDEDPAVK